MFERCYGWLVVGVASFFKRLWKLVRIVFSFLNASEVAYPVKKC